nr:DNA helicase [Tanacetum cinerariifolium]
MNVYSNNLEVSNLKMNLLLCIMAVKVKMLDMAPYRMKMSAAPMLVPHNFSMQRHEVSLSCRKIGAKHFSPPINGTDGPTQSRGVRVEGDHEGSEIGTRLILPTSFTGGSRYMYNHYLDALAICRVLGNPQFFITFTCNVNRPKIQRYMEKYQELTIADKADIAVRAFQQKVEEFCRLLIRRRPFGVVTRLMYTIEFQMPKTLISTFQQNYRILS